MNVAPVGAPLNTLPLEPLGACWECHVFACRAHAERERKSGKWLCYPSVATALAGSAGLDEAAELQFTTSTDFERRLPYIADATAQRRNAWRKGHGEARLGQYLERAKVRAQADFSLAADAIGVAEFLVAGPLGFDQALRPRGEQLRAEGPAPADVLPASLATALDELLRG
jgi:hypothetical protein